MIHRLIAIVAYGCLTAAGSPSNYLRKPPSWFGSPEGKQIASNILSWQTYQGDWPKNEDTTSNAFTGDRSTLKGTFDNGATTDELRFLASAVRATNDGNLKKSFLLGLDHILEAQYANGGWPQYFPLSNQYHRHITFNDGSMIRLMEFLREVSTSEEFKFIDSQRRTSAAKAVDRGIECILKCQIIVNGKPTVWCAQHDEVTLAPAPARAFELVSLSGSESVGILRFLMSIEKPSSEVVRAVNAGVSWFKATKIEGISVVKVNGDRTVIKDANGPPLWARFYDIGTNRPFFCGRDGVKKYELSEIESERRNGYAWYGNWGENLIKAYDKWPYR